MKEPANSPVNGAMPDREFARAKVNLTLHVTGRRPDGYHILDSLVVFPEIGDVLSVAGGDGLTLAIDGRFSGGLDAADNLVLRAARMMQAGGQGAALHLTKNLPVASGIGGGSADAAAALRLLARYWKADLPDAGALASLGADIPVCLASTHQRMRGIGENTEPVPGVPPFWLLLVNDGTPIATSVVFAALNGRISEPMPEKLPQFSDVHALATFLAGQRNDLEEPAREAFPGIATVLTALRSTDLCLLVRMSGSGGTCFAMYETQVAALAARRELRLNCPDWWVKAALVAGAL